jgi:hypothetical protein
MPKRNLLFAAATVLALFLSSLTDCCLGAGESVPPIPARVTKPSAFAVEPWKVDSVSLGDLNKDGAADAALIVSIEGDGLAAAHRKLIIALKKGKGYEKVVESDKATMLGCGPSGGVPSVEIKKGVVIVNHYCGSRERYEYWHKYQIRNGQFILIGYTAASNDSLDPASKQRVDVNTMTGEISANYSSAKGSVNERILELWAAPIEGEEPSPSDWGAPAVHVSAMDDRGKVSATLQAVHSKKKLFVKAQLDDDHPLTSGEVCLVDAKGNVLPTDSSRATIYGYRVNTYDLNSGLLKDMLAKDSGNDEHLLRLSVTVKPHAGSVNKLTTCGKKRPGAIFLSKNKGAPELKDVDIRDGDQIHPFFKYDDI